MGSADTYFLTDAVYFAQDTLESLKDPAWGGEIAYGDRAEHCWNGDPKLPNAYYGNPGPGYKGQDSTEAFAFLNFYGMGGTTFNKIVLSDPSTTSGFESDNHTVRVTPYGSDPNDTSPTIPGVPVEEIINNNGSQTIVTNTAQINTSPEPVPEPGAASLLGLAGVAALWRVLKQRR